MSAPLAERATQTRERLGGLAAAGGRTFAPAAVAFAEGLLARGEALGGEAGARLVARAETRTEELARELEAVKDRARTALDAAGDPSGAGAKALEAGELGLALRAARREAVAGTPRAPDGEERAARLRAEAAVRGVAPRADALSPEAIVAALYASSRAELSATIVALRAQADVPFYAGPYNGLAIAARALAELSTLSPGYLTAMVAYLDELSPLFALPPVSSAARERSRASRAAKFRGKR